MCIEPQFLNDESLLSNLEEENAIRVQKWLLLIHKNTIQELDNALSLARDINKFFGTTDKAEKENLLSNIKLSYSDVFCVSNVDDPNIFSQIMTQLEEKYDQKKIQ